MVDRHAIRYEATPRGEDQAGAGLPGQAQGEDQAGAGLSGRGLLPRPPGSWPPVLTNARRVNAGRSKCAPASRIAIVSHAALSSACRIHARAEPEPRPLPTQSAAPGSADDLGGRPAFTGRTLVNAAPGDGSACVPGSMGGAGARDRKPACAREREPARARDRKRACVPASSSPRRPCRAPAHAAPGPTPRGTPPSLGSVASRGTRPFSDRLQSDRGQYQRPGGGIWGRATPVPG